MATNTERYERATSYAHRAIDSVSGSLWSSSFIDYYVNRDKTATARHNLDQIEARWWRAKSDGERSRIARDSELLADRIKENLPGAPQDWQRTNLTAGEREQSTPATSYRQEVSAQAGQLVDDASAASRSAWSWAKQQGEQVSKLGTFLLIGGGLYVGARLLSLARARQSSRVLISLENAASKTPRGAR